MTPSKLKPLYLQHRSITLIKGMYQCKKSKFLMCKHALHDQKQFKMKGKNIKVFYNCSLEYVVYWLTCSRGLFYVGRTIRTLRKWFGKHYQFVEERNNKHSVPRHFLEHHNKWSDGLKLWVIGSIPKKYSVNRRPTGSMFWTPLPQCISNSRLKSVRSSNVWCPVGPILVSFILDLNI